jgi:hypothetical protein
VYVGVCEGVLQVPPYHRDGVVPFRQLVASLKIVNNLRSVRAAQLHEKVEAVIHHVGHERLHVFIAKFASCVHVLQFLGIAEAIMGHLLGEPLSEGGVVF